MKSQFLPIPEPQFSRSRRQIYMSSIGKLRDKEVSCHIDQDRKRIIYQKKQNNLQKTLLSLVIKIEKQAFDEILKFTKLTRRQNIDMIFLPEALLKNDRQVIKYFRQKLSVGQIDRYISLNIPKTRSQSTKLEKSFVKLQKSTFETATVNKRQKKAQKDVDSTYIDNRQNSYGSKSIEIMKIKQHKEKNGAKVLQFNVSSTGKMSVDKSQISKSKSKSKRDIIHIKYTEFSVGSGQGKTPEPKIGVKQVGNDVSEFKINEFSLQDAGEVKTNKNNKNGKQKIECESFFSSSETVLRELKEFHSPYIGKNRLKNSRFGNFSCGRQFESIDIEY